MFRHLNGFELTKARLRVAGKTGEGWTYTAEKMLLDCQLQLINKYTESACQCPNLALE